MARDIGEKIMFEPITLKDIFKSLPKYPTFEKGIRRAPKRQAMLNDKEKVLALKNALRYIPNEWHDTLIPEFLDELESMGRIYGYRFRPKGRIYGKPIEQYKAQTLEKLMELLNKNVIPVVLEKGSLGASGDLSPLSHMSLPLLGLGEVFYEGIRMPAKEGLEKAGILPLERLKAKEGLSLINGTQGMSAIGSLLFYDAEKLIKVAHAALALTMEALGGIKDAFDDEIHLIRKQKGQIQSASWIRALLKGSTYVTRQNELRV
ncbi:MAG: hypothetical protein CVV62_01290, partial [Tenericutes bacterium HGW-Tenericutes-7]